MAMTRGKKILLSVVVVLVALAGTAIVLPPLLWGDGVDYSRVTSIKSTRRVPRSRFAGEGVGASGGRKVPFRDRLSGQRQLLRTDQPRQRDALARVGGDQQTVLAGTDVSTFLGFLPGGITLDRLATVAQQRLGQNVTVLRDLDMTTFKENVRLSNDPSRRYVINFTRGPLFGTGGGHHSPIAGYLSDEDLVFVLDVNKKYGPWLVKPDRLYEAMNTVDRGAGKKRGMLLARSPVETK